MHDIGKLLSLFGEDDWNVDGLNELILTPGVAGGGIDQVTTNWNHDEFGWAKMRRWVPRDVAFAIRYHSFVPLVEGKLDDRLTAEEASWMWRVRMLYEYDHKTKSCMHAPRVEMTEAHRVIAAFLPPRILF